MLHQQRPPMQAPHEDLRRPGLPGQQKSQREWRNQPVGEAGIAENITVENPTKSSDLEELQRESEMKQPKVPQG